VSSNGVPTVLPSIEKSLALHASSAAMAFVGAHGDPSALATEIVTPLSASWTPLWFVTV
jgi:hypothetical protein